MAEVRNISLPFRIWTLCWPKHGEKMGCWAFLWTFTACPFVLWWKHRRSMSSLLWVVLEWAWQCRCLFNILIPLFGHFTICLFYRWQWGKLITQLDFWGCSGFPPVHLPSASLRILLCGMPLPGSRTIWEFLKCCRAPWVGIWAWEGAPAWSQASQLMPSGSSCACKTEYSRNSCNLSLSTSWMKRG